MVLTKILTIVYSNPHIRIFVSTCFLENISLVQKSKKRLHLNFSLFYKISDVFSNLHILHGLVPKFIEAYERYANIILHPGAHFAYICTDLINLECKLMHLNGDLERKYIQRETIISSYCTCS